MPSPSVSSQKRAVIYDPNFAAALKTESVRGKTRVRGLERLRQFSKEECRNCLVFYDCCTSSFAIAHLR